MSEVIALKLTTGEEILATLVKSPTAEEPQYTIKEPIQLQLVPTGKELGIATTPWIMSCADSEIYIPVYHVICQIKPEQSLVKRYKELTSGLDLSSVMPTSKIQLNG